MQKIKNRSKRFLSFILAMILVLLPANISYAVDDTEAETNITESTEPADESETEAALEEERNQETEESEESSQSDVSIIDYVYIESPTLYTPDTQNILIGLNTSGLTSAELTYKSDNTGETFVAGNDAIDDESALFSFDFDDSAATGLYTITEFSYVLNGQSYIIAFDAGDQEHLKFGVNQEYSDASDEDEISAEDIEMEIVTIDENGETTSVDSIAEAIEAAEEESAIASRSTTSRAAGNVVVVLDPGHDATHTGASANGLKEEVLNLKIAQYCKAELEEYGGVTVYMTRESEACPYPGTSSGTCNANRVDYAASVGASVYVSIHLNSASSTANGAEVYYPNSNYNSAVSSTGKALAEKILEKLTALGLNSRGIKTRDSDDGTTYSDGSVADYYGVIRRAKEKGIPAIIIEHAFVTGSSDAAFLSSESNLKALGVADATAIAEYYGLSKGVSISGVNVVNVNEFTGTFDVQVSGVSPENSVAKVLIPIWSEENGQDDIIWYQATAKGNGIYSVTVDIKNHGNSQGKYYAHTYIEEINGSLTLMNATSVSFYSQDINEVSTTASDLDGTESTYRIKTNPLRATEVQFAVWSSENGQDDIVWYNASKDSDGSWYYDVKISNHKSFGDYYVHTYIRQSDGSLFYLNATAFTVSKPTADDIKVINQDDSAGTFQVKVSGIKSASGVSNVQVPIWSASDQNDIVWYTADKQSDGSYLVNASIANHNYNSGTYSIHVYVTGGNGVMAFVGNSFCTAKTPETTISASDTLGTETNYKLEAKNVMLSNIKTVQFAVWSSVGGQDDIIWYTGTKSSTGNWYYNLDVSRHTGLGEYMVHVYGTTTSGTLAFVGNTSFTLSSPAVSSVTVLNQDDSAGTFQVKVSGITSASGISKVQVPIWTASDQNDIVWYTADKQSDGSYLVNASIANHNYNTGTYNIHVYVTTGNGNLVYVGNSSCTVKTQDLEMTVSATDTSGTETSYKLDAKNVTGSNIKSVQFAVWSNVGGQDDIIWYEGTKSSTGNWYYNLDVSRHTGLGEYMVHVYGTTTSGTLVFVGNTSFTLSSPSVSSVTVLNQDDSAGTFQVKVSGIASASGVSKVQIPIWTASDQNDIVWYTADKQSDGSYLVNASIANHKYNTGTYNIHVYVTTGNGNLVFVGNSSCTVEAQTLEATVSATDTLGTETSYKLEAKNVSGSNIKSLQFAVWSNVGGQDDIIWYTGTQASTGNWYYDLDVSRHTGFGEYMVHVYALTTSGIQVFVGNTSFTLSTPTASSVTVLNQDDSTGTFQVKVSGITSASGVSKVQVPVWSQNDQGDIVWYTASKQSDDSYLANVSYANHKYNTGTYNIHAYVTSGNGNLVFVGNSSCTVTTTLYEIMGTSSVTTQQMADFFNSFGYIYPSAALGAGGASTIIEFCQIYMEEASAEGVKVEVAFCQAMKETGYLRFGGDVQITQFNFAGIGATGGGVAGWSFADVRTGIRAQIQHLKAYGSTAALVNECVDPRFKYVARGSSQYVEWLGIQENPNGAGWASAANYGYDIVTMIAKLKKF